MLVMAILQSCCCWRSLRKGSYASAIFTSLYYSVTALIVATFLHEERQYFSGNMSVPQSNSFLEPESISQTSMTFSVIMLCCACIGIITSILLMYGLYRDNRILLMPWVLTLIATILLDLSHSLFLLIDSVHFNPMTGIVYTADFFLHCLNVYCILCVVSQYQEYKAGRGTAGHDVLESKKKVPPVRYTAQPTGTSCLSTRRAATYHETRATPTQSPTVAHSSLPGDSETAPTKMSRKHVQFGDEPSPGDTGDFLHAHWKQSQHTSDLGRNNGEEASVRWSPTEISKPVNQVVDTDPLIHPVSPSSPNGPFFENK